MIYLRSDFLPSPPVNGFHIGPLLFHAYGLAYVVAVIAAVTITVRRWEAKGGERDLVYEVALWGFPAGVIGGRLYFLATSCSEVPPHWWGPFAVWKGGLGIWGGIAAGTLAGVWVIRRRGANIPVFMDAAATSQASCASPGLPGSFVSSEPARSALRERPCGAAARCSPQEVYSRSLALRPRDAHEQRQHAASRLADTSKRALLGGEDGYVVNDPFRPEF